MGRAPASLTIARRGVVEAAGVRAAEVLKTGRHGSIVAAFEHSFYVAFAETGDALVSFGGPGFPLGPINVATTLPAFSSVAPGMPAFADGVSIVLGDAAALHVDFGRFKVWRPPPAERWTQEAVARGVVALRRLDSGRAEACAAPINGCPTVDGVISRRVEAGAGGLRAWLSGETSSDARARKGVKTLLGLGHGLTPSGDDFLVGVLIALAELGDRRRFAILAEIVSDLAPGRTGRVSVAHLAAAVTGMATEPLHRTVRAILGGGEGLDAALAALEGVGHTSGRDALAGALAVLEAVGLRHDRRPGCTARL